MIKATTRRSKSEFKKQHNKNIYFASINSVRTGNQQSESAIIFIMITDDVIKEIKVTARKPHVRYRDLHPEIISE